MDHGHALIESVAAVVLVGLGAVFLCASWWARAHAPARPVPTVDQALPDRSPAIEKALAAIVASFLGGAATVHLAVTQAHAQADALSGQGFALVAITQFALAALVLTRATWVRPTAVIVCASVIGLWAVSRTVGLPVGAHPWVAEPIGAADAIATALQIGSIAVLVGALDHRMQPRSFLRRAADATSVAAVPAVGIAGLVTLIALVSLAGGATHTHT